MLANQSKQRHVKNVVHHYKKGFILRIQRWLSLSMWHTRSTEWKKENDMIISIVAEAALAKTQYSFMINIFNKIGTKWLIQHNICKNPDTERQILCKLSYVWNIK